MLSHRLSGSRWVILEKPWRVTARQKEDMFLLSKWMEALTQVVDISGWDANNFW
jgi:hypothetical protein